MANSGPQPNQRTTADGELYCGAAGRVAFSRHTTGGVPMAEPITLEIFTDYV
jgi:hypothetical protein